MARVHRSGLTQTLAARWTGQWRVVTAEKKHVYSVQNITSGEVCDLHVARMRFYSDSRLLLTSGFEEDEDSWAPLKSLWEDTPQLVKQQLGKMKLGRDVYERLERDYGITL